MSAPLERLLFELIFIAVTPPNILFFFLYNFIDKFVLCQNWEKPELELYLDKNNLCSNCDACSGINILTFDNKFYKSINNI